MFTIQVRKRAKKFIESLPKKHKRQVKDYVIELGKNPKPQDSKELVGYKPYLRGDIGEYRVIYQYSKSDQIVTIALIGKRNGGAVYQQMKRILQSAR